MDDEYREAVMLCPYCSAAFSPNMEVEYSRISAGCDTCGWGSETEVSVDIHCETCGRLVYRKVTRQ